MDVGTDVWKFTPVAYMQDIGPFGAAAQKGKLRRGVLEEGSDDSKRMLTLAFTPWS